MFRFIKNNWMLVLPVVVILALLLPKIIKIISNMMNGVETASEAIAGAVNVVTDGKTTGQVETEVKALEEQLSKVPVVNKNLTKDLSYYKSMALTLYNHLQSWQPDWWAIPESVYKELGTLNKDELLQVRKDFGIKENVAFAVVSQGKGDLIYWLKLELSDPWFFGFKYRTEMQKIWYKTGLWSTV